MKPGTKITLGFASLIAIAVVLGGIRAWNLLSVKRHATAMKSEEVSAGGVASKLERHLREATYALGMIEESVNTANAEESAVAA